MNKGKRIRQKREELAISQTEFANMVGISKQTLYKYEHNIVTNIPSDKLEKMARVLGVEPSYLMGWDYSRVASGHTPGEVIIINGSSSNMEEKAKELYRMYKQVSPEVQQAVELMLKSAQPKP